MEYMTKLFNKISVERIKIELYKTAFGSNETLISRLDPRILIIWYLIFALIPWFIFDRAVLIGLFLFVAAVAYVSKVSKFIIFLLCTGIAMELLCYSLVAYIFGGGVDAFLAMTVLTLKLVVISLSSIAIFCNMDPERLSDALLSFGVPGHVTFAVSYGYRMVPVLIEEYNNIINSYRLRGVPPDKKGFLYWRQIAYMLNMAVGAFYPLVLNTAKRTRTTVEALEVRGFSYALLNREVKKLKLSYLKIGYKEMAFLLGSLLYIYLLISIL
ncbi:energy-coupling factor transporter transmembrane protein EcfT [Oxobacter pfennigii]|uniref:Energy-coupling factor transporter transmembrane protein EcfT n=1 Tax=Oxobacter pfennigii TaxID=36849 RepID=A0A0N8NSL7_9CLOT|nr:energy-coupling factor transporter transmembrane component T [Oxobacter pfennigii]KPU42384.1 energy-coupling factor transporter transmembrane protein EcfT [Oxobacter pfennigii]